MDSFVADPGAYTKEELASLHSQILSNLEWAWELSGGSEETNMTDAAQDVKNVAQAWVDAFKQKDAKACTATYTEDGWILSPYGLEAHGHEAIEQTHKAWIDADEKNKQLAVLEAVVDGDLAYTLVAYSGDYQQEDGTWHTETGKCVNVLKRQPDGTWKMHISSLNSDTPPLA